MKLRPKGILIPLAAGVFFGFAAFAAAQSPLDTEMPDYPIPPRLGDADEILVQPAIKGRMSVKTNGDAPTPSIELAGRLARKKEYRRAIEILDALAGKESGGNAASHAYLRGLALKEMGSPDEARGPLREAAADPLLGDWALMTLMELEEAAGEAAHTIAAADELTERFPYSPLAEAAGLMKAKGLLGTGLYLKAELLLREMLANGIKTPEKGWMLLAQTQEKAAKPAEAYASYAKVWISYPAAPFANEAKDGMDRLKKDGGFLFRPLTAAQKLERAETLMQNKMYKEAIAYITELDKNAFTHAHRAQIYLHLGRAMERTARKDDAIDAYQHAATTPDRKLRGEALYRSARILWNRDEDERAVELINRILKETPGTDVAPSAIYVLARMDESAGRRAEAIKKFDRVATVWPGSSMAELSLWYAGWLRYQDEDFAGAETALLKLADRNEDSSAAPMGLYWAIRAAERQGKDTAPLLERLNRRYPLSYYTLLLRGDALLYRIPSPLPTAASGTAEEARDRIRIGLARFAYRPALSEKGMWALASAQTWIRLGFPARAREPLAAVAAETPAKRDTLTWLAAQYHAAECYQCIFRAADEILKEEQEPDYLAFLKLLIFPAPYWNAVADEARANGIDPFLALSVMRQESIFDPEIVSIADAHGLMQLIPPTAARMARELHMEPPSAEQLHIPEQNIKLGTRYLSGLVKEEGGDLALALATYNAGPNPVAKWKERFGNCDPAVFVERIPYSETREYVKKVLRNYAFYRTIYKDQLSGPPVNDRRQ